MTSTAAGIRFGGAAIGNLYWAVEPEVAAAALATAVRLGIDSVDTAPLYGCGLSETRIGAFLRELPGAMQVSTKVGRSLVPRTCIGSTRHGFVDTPALDAVFDSSSDAIRRGFDASLARLGVAHVDTLLLHDVGRATHGERHGDLLRQVLDEALPAMVALRDNGLIDRIGLGVNEVDVVDELLTTGVIDVVLVAGRYTLLDQSAGPVFDRCRARGVAVLAAGVYNSGLLAGGAMFDYAPAEPAVCARRDALAAVAARHAVALPAAALAFARAHPAVEQIVVGLRSPKEVVQTLAWMDTPVPAGFWDELADGGLLAAGTVVPR